MWTLSSSLAEKESFESQKIAAIANDGEQDITSQEDIETLQSTEAPNENTTPTQDQNVQLEQDIPCNQLQRSKLFKILVIHIRTENQFKKFIDFADII